jgi:hypothetical protein
VYVLACAHHSCSCGLGLGLVALICAHVCLCALVCGSCLGEVCAGGGVWLKEAVAKHNCDYVRGSEAVVELAREHLTVMLSQDGMVSIKCTEKNY